MKWLRVSDHVGSRPTKVSVCEEYTQVVSSCDIREASNTVKKASPASMDKSGLQVAARKFAQGMHTPCTVLVWIDGARRGRTVSCKSLSAGAVRLRKHAIDTPILDRWETLDHCWKQDRRLGEKFQTHRASVNRDAGGAQDTAERATTDRREASPSAPEHPGRTQHFHTYAEPRKTNCKHTRSQNKIEQHAQPTRTQLKHTQPSKHTQPHPSKKTTSCPHPIQRHPLRKRKRSRSGLNGEGPKILRVLPSTGGFFVE